jgi:hypothetical protein
MLYQLLNCLLLVLLVLLVQLYSCNCDKLGVFLCLRQLFLLRGLCVNCFDRKCLDCTLLKCFLPWKTSVNPSFSSLSSLLRIVKPSTWLLYHFSVMLGSSHGPCRLLDIIRQCNYNAHNTRFVIID